MSKPHTCSGGESHFLDRTAREVMVLLAVRRLGKLAFTAAIREMVASHAKVHVDISILAKTVRAFVEHGMLESQSVAGRGGRNKVVYRLTDRAERALERILEAESELVNG